MRAVVNVSLGAHYIKGQDRLLEEVSRQGLEYVHWRDRLPGGCPEHADVPYAFKAYALKQAAEEGYTTLLWCDSSILPVKPLRPLFESIERDGYWIGNNGWSNYEWTADAAYPGLFHEEILHCANVAKRAQMDSPCTPKRLREINRRIPHVVATAFGISLEHPTGRAILDEYYRLASTTKAFCGPWWNHSFPEYSRRADSVVCGPPDVRGHRHDQTALSVIAWRLGCKLTNSPDILVYGKAGEARDERTILLADGAYA